MKIISLIENNKKGKNLQAEHGLSIYLETANKKILFDTGASDKYIKNAGKLNIDLQAIDEIIISHGIQIILRD